MTRQYISESMGHEEAEKAAVGGINAGEKIGKSTLEDATRESTLRDHGTPEERFWQRQQGQDETIAIGRMYIQKVYTCYLLRKRSGLTQIGCADGDEG